MWENLVETINDMIEKYEISEEDQKLISDAVTKCYDGDDEVYAEGNDEVYGDDEVYADSDDTEEEVADAEVEQEEIDE